MENNGYDHFGSAVLETRVKAHYIGLTPRHDYRPFPYRVLCAGVRKEQETCNTLSQFCSIGRYHLMWPGLGSERSNGGSSNLFRDFLPELAKHLKRPEKEVRECSTSQWFVGARLLLETLAPRMSLTYVRYRTDLPSPYM